MRTASSSSDGVPSKVNTPGALDSGEIVPRDTAGGYKAVIPMLPTLLPDDGGNEMEGIEQAGAADDIVDLGMSGRERESTFKCYVVLPVPGYWVMDLDGLLTGHHYNKRLKQVLSN